MKHPGVKKTFSDDISRFLEFREGDIITHEEMSVIDRNAQALGVEGQILMEAAGTALANYARSMITPSSPPNVPEILILCGAGNNGGDGMVAARHLQHDAMVTVLWYDSPSMTPSTRTNLKHLKSCAARLIPFRCPDDLIACSSFFSQSSLIIDSLLGTGMKGEKGDVREPLRTCIRLASASGTPILAADVPSPGVTATRTCAFHRKKTEDAEVAGIGIPLFAEICTGPGDLLMLPGRSADAHKGAGGSVFVIGGGPYQGAPWLTALGALRGGADLVRVASFSSFPEPDIIHIPLSGDRLAGSHIEILAPLCSSADVVVFGPGLGAESHEVVVTLARLAKKAVIDADALRLPLPLPDTGQVLYTPHAGEFSRITGITVAQDLYERACMARDAHLPGTVLLKGPVDVITDRSRVRFNRTGTPAMTTGGTGDILAGVCAAQMVHLPAFEAACIGSYVCGCAGEMVAERYGYGTSAPDLLHAIPQVLFGSHE